MSVFFVIAFFVSLGGLWILGLYLREKRLHRVRLSGRISSSELPLFDLSIFPNPTIVTDGQGHILALNEGFSRLSGFSIEDVKGQRPSMFGSGQTPYAVFVDLWRAILGGERWQADLSNRHKEGHTYWARVALSPHYDANGRLTHILASYTDVTALKLAEKALKAEHTLFAGMPGAIFQYLRRPDGSSSFPFASGGLAALFGLPPSLLEAGNAKPFSQRVDAEDRQRLKASLEFSAVRLQPWHAEFRIVRPDGRVRWIEGWGSPSRVDGGGTVWYGFLADISGRKEAEAALHAQENSQRQMFEQHSAMMLLVDPATGDIVDANLSASRFYGYPLSVLRSMNMSEINVMSREVLLSEMAMAVQHRSNNFVFGHRLASGEDRIVEVNASPVIFGGRTILFSIIEDITIRKQAEEALADANARMDALLSSIPDVVIMKDPDNHWMFVNQTGMALFDLHDDGWRGLKGREVARHYGLSGEVFERAGEDDEAAWRAHEPTLVVRKGLGADGQLNELEVRRVPMFTADGARKAMVLIARNVTQARTDQRQLELLLRNNTLLLESMGEGVYGVDTAGVTTFINPAALMMLGFSDTDLLGRNMHDQTHYAHGDGRAYPQHACPVTQTLLDGQTRRSQEWFWRKGGDSFPVTMTVTAIRSEHGVTGAVVVFQEVLVFD